MTLGRRQPDGVPLRDVLPVLKPHVELLADGILEPAPVPSVYGLNLVGATGGQKPRKRVELLQKPFPKIAFRVPQV